MSTLCIKTQNQLSEYIDGVLSTESAWKVQMHLTVCSECASVAAELQKTVSLIQGSTTLSLSSAFDEELNRRIAELSPKDVANGGLRARFAGMMGSPYDLIRSWRGWTIAVAGASAALCVFAFSSLTFLKPIDGPAPSVPGVVASPSDMAFIAACSSDNARYQSSQPLADPMAQTLAARTDATGARGSALTSSDSETF